VGKPKELLGKIDQYCSKSTHRIGNLIYFPNKKNTHISPSYTSFTIK